MRNQLAPLTPLHFTSRQKSAGYECDPRAQTGAKQMNRAQLKYIYVEQIAQHVSKGESQPGRDNVEDDAACWTAKEQMKARPICGREKKAENKT